MQADVLGVQDDEADERELRQRHVVLGDGRTASSARAAAASPRRVVHLVGDALVHAAHHADAVVGRVVRIPDVPLVPPPDVDQGAEVAAEQAHDVGGVAGRHEGAGHARQVDDEHQPGQMRKEDAGRKHRGISE